MPQTVTTSATPTAMSTVSETLSRTSSPDSTNYEKNSTSNSRSSSITSLPAADVEPSISDNTSSVLMDGVVPSPFCRTSMTVPSNEANTSAADTSTDFVVRTTDETSKILMLFINLQYYV